MKSFTALIILSILINIPIFAAAYPDMKGYPDFFNEDGGVLSVTLVVGENAPSSDVLSATDISGYLVFKTKSEHINSVLSNEINSYQQDMILIGNPCDNPHVAYFLKTQENNCHVTDKGEALITAFKEGNYIYVVVAGNNPEGTRIAAKILQEPDVFKIEGSDLCVYGTFTNPFVEDCATSQYTPSDKKSAAEESEKIKNKETIKATSTASSKKTSQSIELFPQPTPCSGCLDADKICYFAGEQAQINNRTAYCKDDHKWYASKKDGKACNENYQCTHGYCVEHLCTAKAPPEKPFLSRFFSWMWDVIFG